MTIESILFSCGVIFILLVLENRYKRLIKKTVEKYTNTLKPISGVYAACSACGENNLNGEKVEAKPIQGIVSMINYDGLDASYCPSCFKIFINNEKLYGELLAGVTEESTLQILKQLEAHLKFYEILGETNGQIFVQALLSNAANNQDELSELLCSIFERARLEPGDDLETRISSAITKVCSCATK